MPPRVSVVIVSWNVRELLRDCLDSLSKSSEGLDLDVIVVDNASADGTCDELRGLHPDVRLLANSANVGFARANNQGFELCDGDYVLILNPDTVVRPGALRALLDRLERDATVGMVGPRLIYPDGRIQSVCARQQPSVAEVLFCTALQLHRLPWVGAWFERRYGIQYDFETSQDVDAISGAAMLIRRGLLRELGGFGESYVHGGEDLELCFRVRSAGYRVFYESDAAVVHFSGASAVQAPVWTFVNWSLSVHEYFRRCHGARQALLFRLVVQLVHAPLLVLAGLGRLLFGRGSRSDLRTRWAIASGVWRWQRLGAEPDARAEA